MLKRLFYKLYILTHERAIRGAMRKLPQYHIFRQKLINDDMERTMRRSLANLQTYTEDGHGS